MKLLSRARPHCRAAAGHSLPEVIIAVSLVGVMFISLYAGFTTGFGILRSARENLRATEILNEQTERIRLLNWSQVNSASYLPATFVERFDPADDSPDPSGPSFHGRIETSIPNDWPEAYRDRGRLITITLVWTNSEGSTPMVHQRRVQTCVARYGLQSYVAAP
ncbi:MAG TPA: hypothetical protein VFZ59_23500 [Verrucomicrobiae bacterium]|nr:hypothetical protein [Verrucomicrobiae bacterium]